MKISVILLAVVTLLAFAGGEFATGGSELWKFKGYNIFRLHIEGAEDPPVDFAFSGVTTIFWMPQITENLSANVCSKIFTTTGEFKLYDLWMDWEIADGMTVRAGQFNRPIGYAALESGMKLLFADRAWYTSGFSGSGFGIYGKRDTGVNLIGDFGQFGFDLAFTNGSGWNALEDDCNKQFTTRLLAKPDEWITLAGSFGIYTADDTLSTEEDATYSANAFGGYAVVDYPAGENVTVNFVGEYLNLGYNGPDIDGLEKKSGSVMAALLGAKFGVDAGTLTAIQPVVRYEMISPATQLADGADEPQDNTDVIDFCVNMHFGNMNTIQLGGRNISYESEGVDSQTDMYINWRVCF